MRTHTTVKHLLLATLLATLLGFGPLAADEWAEALPDESEELVRKLLAWEAKERADSAARIEEKRDAVAVLLKKKQATVQAGTDSAFALQHLIDYLNSEPVDSVMEPTRSPRVGGGGGVSTEDLFGKLVPRLQVEAFGEAQKKSRKNGAWLTIKLDGRPLKASGFGGPGLHLIVLNEEGVQEEFVAPSPWGADEDELKPHAMELIEKVESLPDGSIAIIAGTRYASKQYTPFLRKIIAPIGGRTREIEDLVGYICIGYRDLRRGGAVEIVGGIGAKEWAIHPEKK